MQTSTNNRVSLILAVLFFLTPALASASTIYMETPPGSVSVGDTIVVQAYLDTDSARVNALDGVITISTSSAFTVKSINLDGSVLSLWPQTPSLLAGGKSISFTGGLPGGFTGTHLLLFSIILKADSPGQEVFSPTTTTLYLNDGKGTPTPVNVKTFAITAQSAQAGAVPRDESLHMFSSKTAPPATNTGNNLLRTLVIICALLIGVCILGFILKNRRQI